MVAAHKYKKTGTGGHVLYNGFRSLFLGLRPVCVHKTTDGYSFPNFSFPSSVVTRMGRWLLTVPASKARLRSLRSMF